MEEHEWLQELELTDGVVSTSGSLLSLFSEDTDTNMSLKDHVDVVSSITNRESDLIGESLSNHVHNIGLLLW